MTSGLTTTEGVDVTRTASAPALTSLDDVRALLVDADPQGRLVPCELRELIVGEGTLERTAEVVARLAPQPAGRRRRVTVLVDETPILRGTQDVKVFVTELLATDADTETIVLSDGHAELHVTPEVVDSAIARSVGSDVIVAVGGGTISDIAKLVSTAIQGLPVVTVMTAASVDGYTDNVSVTLKEGVKRTVPSVWPDVVVADAQTVAGAPARMNRAGYGEMTSMYVAPADWRLAALIGIDTSFHPAPVLLLDALSAELDACAAGVAAGQPQAVQQLTWALALRGIATGVADSTACLSGVEHLVSHMLDLRAAQLHLPTGLHGEQVGTGSVVAACAWELLHERMAADPGARVRIEALDATAAQSRVAEAFGALDPSGRIAQECWGDYARKLERIRGSVSGIDAVLARWDEHTAELTALVRPSAVIAAGLRAAGTPALLSELGADIDATTARWAIACCALMRDRFTVVDLLTLLGWWEPADIDELQARVAAAVASAEGASA
jgi:glycerol-1-phosphate dehydrogenase [NAD(P)+]